ncbi:ribulose-phosphate 3-epimerase [Slackia exigua]|nr:ribulose-phosphate 3-epimerase [Slackia exigua]STN98513.1 Ribulose-phosphate 3-epimerase [Slackia exigua]
MHSDVRISPSILSADFMNMERDIEAITMGGADLIHVDVMDGHFVPNLTIGAPVVEGLSHVARIPLDVHLMVSNPLDQLPWFLKHAPYLVTVHAEALDAEAGEFSQAIDAIHAAGSKACIALRPDTDVDVLAPVIADLDMVLIMSVYPGFSGQSYIGGSDARVARVVEIARAAGASPLIEVDGGLGANEATRAVVAAGADVLVAGSAVFSNGDFATNIAAIRAAASEARTGCAR